MATQQFSFDLPNAPNTRIFVHLTLHAHAIIAFLTTSEQMGGGTCPLGSFIYAMPNLTSPTKAPLTTPLYTHLSTADTATRLARAIAARSQRPTYVGSSATFTGMGRGGDALEEMAAFKRIVDVVCRAVKEGINGEEEEDVPGVRERVERLRMGEAK